MLTDEDVRVEDRPRQRRRLGVMGEFEEYVNAWLEEGMQNRRKDRLTANKAVYEKLFEWSLRNPIEKSGPM